MSTVSNCDTRGKPLPPGWKMVDGELYYSAAWLSKPILQAVQERVEQLDAAAGTYSPDVQLDRLALED